MPVIDRIDSYKDELTAIRRDIHEYPEIGFEEVDLRHRRPKAGGMGYRSASRHRQDRCRRRVERQ